MASSRLPQTPQLADALESQDSAAVAFALRNGEVIVPLLVQPGPSQVRVFRGAHSDAFTLLLFSSAENYLAMLPQETDLQVLSYDRAQLVEFLEAHVDSLETAWFDVAGPAPMQADPRDLLAALVL